MRINPEFRRNVWVQFTWPRLLAAPLVALILAYAFLIVTHQNYALLQSAAELLGGGVIVGLWGTRRAADSLAEEVSGGTWEGQRMSGLGAWQMTWGKLIGSASFVWYCAAIAMIVIFWSNRQVMEAGGAGRPALRVVFDFIVGGVMAQAAAFAIALILLRKAAQYRRLTITLAQSCGFLLFFFAVRGGFGQQSSIQMQGADLPWSGGQVQWYGASYDAQLFRSTMVAVACAWSVLGAYRLMRTELQYRSLPWVWTLFLLFVTVCVAGFNPWPQFGVAAWLAAPFLVLVLLTYAAFFADNRDPVRYRWALLAIRTGDWPQVIGAIPWWIISYVIAAIAAVAIVWSLPYVLGVDATDSSPTPFVGMVVMALRRLPASLALAMLFMLRDLLILLWLSCSPWRAKADVAGIIYLALVYWPLAAILWATRGQYLLPVVIPVATGAPAVDFVPIGIELAFATFLFYARWREITRLKLKR